MTEPEFMEVVRALEEGWPNAAPWPAATVRAALNELQRFDAVDVWAGLHRLFGQGRAFPPSPSELYASAKEAAVDARRYQNTPALPPSKGPTLKEWLASKGFSSLKEAIESEQP